MNAKYLFFCAGLMYTAASLASFPAYADETECGHAIATALQNYLRDTPSDDFNRIILETGLWLRHETIVRVCLLGQACKPNCNVFGNKEFLNFEITNIDSSTIEYQVPISTLISTIADRVNSSKDMLDELNTPENGNFGMLIAEESWTKLIGIGIGIVVGGAICVGTAFTGCAFTSVAMLGTSAGIGYIGKSIASEAGMLNEKEAVGKLPEWRSDWHGCFHLCNTNTRPNLGEDLLTSEVLRPALKNNRRFCINEKNFNLLSYADTKTKEPVSLTYNQMVDIRTNLPNIVNRDKCDGHFWASDAYMVQFISNGMLPDGSFSYSIRTVSDPIRMDE